MKSANTGTPVQQNMSAMEAIAHQYSVDDIYTQEDKNAALGRHTVQQLNVSNSDGGDVMFAGAVGGAVTAGAAKTLAEFSWTIAALAAGVATPLCTLSKEVTQQTTPLQHAEYELAQIKKIKDSLMATSMGSSGFEANGSELFVFQELAQKYNQPCRILRMLWSDAYAPIFENNTTNFINALLRMLREEYHMTRTEGGDKHTGPIMICLVALLHAPNPAQCPGFQKLAHRREVPQEMHNELAELMFLASHIMYGSSLPGALPAKTLYRDRCKANYTYYMDRLEQDVASLENDVRILEATQQQKLQPPTENTTESI